MGLCERGEGCRESYMFRSDEDDDDDAVYISGSISVVVSYLAPTRA